MSTNFKIAKRYRQAAEVINTIPVEKFPQLLTRVFQKLHIKGAKLFSKDEEIQLKSLFGLTNESLGLVLDGCCYTFEQAAFTSTGPEALYAILLDAGFSEAHAKVLGRLWATEASSYVSKLKSNDLGYTALVDSNYHLNLAMGQSTSSKLQEPTAIFELSLLNGDKEDDDSNTNGTSGDNRVAMTEKMCIEFNHGELYSFFGQLEQVQSQLDGLSGQM